MNGDLLHSYFKSYFWTFRLIVLGLTAFLLAQTINAFVGRAIAVPARELGAPGPSSGLEARTTNGEHAATGLALLERNVFKAERLKPAAVDEDDRDTDGSPLPLPEDPSRDNCPPSALRIRLVATVVTADPTEATAVFQDGKKVVSVRVRDELGDEAEVLAIRPRDVYVRRGDACERFSLEQDVRPAVSMVQIPERRRPAGRAATKGIRKVSNREWFVERSKIDGILSNTKGLARQVRIVPADKGFRLASIRRNSVLTELGLKKGDVIRGINGFDLDGPDKALMMYSRLKDAKSISVDLVRGGRRMSLSYIIR